MWPSLAFILTDGIVGRCMAAASSSRSVAAVSAISVCLAFSSAGLDSAGVALERCGPADGSGTSVLASAVAGEGAV
jgi:hypothetical protein